MLQKALVEVSALNFVACFKSVCFYFSVLLKNRPYCPWEYWTWHYTNFRIVDILNSWVNLSYLINWWWNYGMESLDITGCHSWIFGFILKSSKNLILFLMRIYRILPTLSPGLYLILTFWTLASIREWLLSESGFDQRVTYIFRKAFFLLNFSWIFNIISKAVPYIVLTSEVPLGLGFELSH